PRVRGHLEGAQLNQALPAVGSGWVEQLVDADFGAMRVAGQIHQEMAKQQIRHPRGSLVSRFRKRTAERQLQLCERLVGGLVDARSLGGGADEQSGEEIRERGVMLQKGQKTREQRGAFEEGTLQRRRSPQRQVMAASAACHAPVELKSLGMQAGMQSGIEH